MGKKLTTSEFIEKSIKIHGHKYDYSLVDYVNSSLHVKIIYNNIVNILHHNIIIYHINTKVYHNNMIIYHNNANNNHCNIKIYHNIAKFM